MSRPIVEELNFTEFRRALDKATAAGTRIIPSDTQRWQQYVKTHTVREHNFKAYAAGKFDGLQPVIIDDAGEWGGYYLWSAVDEVVLRWRRPTT